jgi:Transposase DDE domain
MKRAGLAATIKARWICEQAHQQLKEKLGLDHFEGRSWQGLHRHALMTMIAYAFLQHRHLTQVGRKKESTDRRLSLACRPYATPSSISFFDHYLSNAHTAEDEAVKNSGVGKSAKVVLDSGIKKQPVGQISRRQIRVGKATCPPKLKERRRQRPFAQPLSRQGARRRQRDPRLYRNLPVGRSAAHRCSVFDSTLLHADAAVEFSMTKQGQRPRAAQGVPS